MFYRGDVHYDGGIIKVAISIGDKPVRLVIWNLLQQAIVRVADVKC